VLTHTNAGVAALRGRLDRARVASSSYRLSTIDGWAIRLATAFPRRSGLDLAAVECASPNYPAIRLAANRLLAGGHVQDALSASFAKIIVDEYQDCAIPQHEMICHAAKALPTVLLGDPLQGIFNWRGNEPPDWDGDVCRRFPVIGELQTPWRWINARTAEFGHWLLDMRKELRVGRGIDLGTAPGELEWIHLDGTDDEAKRRAAARVRVPDAQAKVIILGDNRPATHRRIASQTPGAITVEAVDLRDLVDFAKTLNFGSPDAALRQVLDFAGSLMTNVTSTEIIARVATLTRGTARTEPTDVEHAALAFRTAPSPAGAANLLSAITASPGVRAYRTGVLRATFRALGQCDGSPGNSFAEAAIRVREQNRLIGRPMAKRSVGSTLLLKGLEAEVAVVLYADDMDARNLYVAMTRGSRNLFVCSRSAKIRPS
jgi:UvrD/REP helicase N-terminal domain